MALDDVQRYTAAAHAMQTAVAIDLDHGSESASPKHLRVGVNSALVDSSALAQLLMKKGVITEDEYEKAVADAMEAEVQRYREWLDLPPNVTLR